VKREFLVAVGGAAFVVAGLAGCSSDKASTESNGTSAAAGSGTSTVTVDGKETKIEGSIACTTAAGRVTIATAGGTSGLGATVTEGDSPTVETVGLGNVDGVLLGVTPGAGEAKAEKDGKTYKISGTASGMDAKNPMAGATTKPFSLEVTCP
jgi:lipoprotein LpqH